MVKRILSLLLVFALVFSLAACGGNNEEPQGNNNEGQENAGQDNAGQENEEEEVVVEYAQGVTDDNVKIGTVAVQAGVLSFIGTPYVSGMKAYFNAVNDNGGVNGRTIEFIAKDDEFNPAKSVAAIEELIYDEEVFAIVGQLGTPGVVAAQDIVKDEGIPSVYFGSGAVSLTEAGENFFPVQPNYVYEGKLMAKYAIEEFEADTVAILYQNDDTGKDGLKGFEDGLNELGKTDALSEDGKIAFGGSDADFTVQIQKAKALDPDVVILYGLSGGVAGILKEVEKVGFDVPMLTTYSNADPSFLAIAAPGAPNMIENLNVLGWLEVTEGALDPLYAAMGEYFPEVPVNAYTMAGWVAGETFVAGLEEAGDNLSWEGYIDAMNNLSFTTGLAPEITYSPGVRQGVTKMAMSKVVKDSEGNYIFEQVTDFLDFK